MTTPLQRATQVYVQSCMHGISQLTRQNPFPVTISNIEVRKRSKHCQYSLDNRYQEAIWAEKRRSADNMRKHCGYSSWSPIWGSAEERSCVVCSDRLGIAPSSSCRISAVNTIIKTELLFSLLFLLLSFLFELFTEWEQRGLEVSWFLQANTADGFWLRMLNRCSIWPLTKEFQCGCVGERSAPR